MKKTLLATLALGLGLASAQSNKNVLTAVTIEPAWSSFDPAYCYDSACSNILDNTLEGLIGFAGDGASTFAPRVASEIPSVANGGITNGGKTYTFKIRPGIKFSDGSPLTAQDVEYSLERLLVYSTETGPAGLLLEPIFGSADLIRKGGKVGYAEIDKAIEARDNSTVVINLQKAFSPFLATMAAYGYIYSKADAIKNNDWAGTAATWEAFNNKAEGTTGYLKKAPLGTGPFAFERLNEGSAVILKRNDNYWRAPAKLERVIITGIKDDTTRIQTLRTGESDYALVGAIPAAQFNTVSQLPGVTGAKKPGLTLIGFFMTHKINGEGTNYLGSGKLDGKGIPSTFFSDINVRKAFAYSFDYGSMVKDVLQGNGTQQNSVLVQGLLGYNKTSPKFKFDKTLATRYFKAAAKGQVWANGFTLPVFYNAGNSTRQRGLEIMKRNIESLNPKFKLEIRELPFAQILSLSAANKLTVWFGGWGADFADPHTFAQPFLAPDGNYPLNIAYRNEALGKLIDQAVSEPTPANRVKLYSQIAKIGFNEVPLVPVYQALSLSINRDNVVGRQFNPISQDYFYPVSKN